MRRRGFTIIELVVVITIIGILLTLGVVNLNGAQANSRDAERKIDTSSIAQHLETYYTSGTDGSTSIGSYPSTALVSNGTSYISQLLRDIDLKTITAPDVADPSLTFISATNAVQTTDGVLPQPTINQYVYQPITSDGNLCTEAAPAVKALVVAGGGGGGGNHGGGGGGGGVLYNANLLLSTQSYDVIVGNGGAGGAASITLVNSGNNGENSSFSSLTAIGGGGGGSRLDTNSVYQAKTGGSGGGGAGTIDSATSLPAAGKTGTAGQGLAGGNGTSDATAGNGGGGGGAGVAGSNAIGSGGWGGGSSGIGGNGLSYDISGTTRYYGGGGSGGYWGEIVTNIGAAGLGGGGLGGYNYSTGKAGTNNTGGGGGGGGGGGAPGGGPGGSGIVIIAYPSGSMSATGGTISYSNGYTIHTFTKNGAFVVSNNKTDCRKFNLYYRTEADNAVHILSSRNQ